MKNHDKNLRILDAVYHEIALIDAEEGPVTPELRRDVDAIMAYTQGRLAEMKRAERRQLSSVPASIAPIVRPSILAMTRDAIMARLAALYAAQPCAGLAHRDLARMTDDDLRTALEDAEALADRGR
jgi:hypothetical protein